MDDAIERLRKWIKQGMGDAQNNAEMVRASVRVEALPVCSNGRRS